MNFLLNDLLHELERSRDELLTIGQKNSDNKSLHEEFVAVMAHIQELKKWKEDYNFFEENENYKEIKVLSIVKECADILIKVLSRDTRRYVYKEHVQSDWVIISPPNSYKLLDIWFDFNIN